MRTVEGCWCDEGSSRATLLSLWIRSRSGRRRTGRADQPGAAHLARVGTRGKATPRPPATLWALRGTALSRRSGNHPLRADRHRAPSSGATARASAQGAYLLLTVFLLPAFRPRGAGQRRGVIFCAPMFAARAKLRYTGIGSTSDSLGSSRRRCVNLGPLVGDHRCRSRRPRQ